MDKSIPVKVRRDVALNPKGQCHYGRMRLERLVDTRPQDSGAMLKSLVFVLRQWEAVGLPLGS